ncbi:MAG TPA: hypothetical protein VLV18_05450 [Terriglobales bacterium]|nr:hypothetical protein [Terriglobales bacterium]
MQVGSETRSMLLPARNRSLKFSQTEIRHLILGTALVSGVGVSFLIETAFTTLSLVVAVVLFSMGFILHELAHKYVAQVYGLWAEFRVNTMGVILTAISIFSPFKFIAPGAVVISGFADNDRMGRTAIAGPIVNVIIAMGLLVTLPALGRTLIGPAILYGASINAFLALFNLIPFWIFDGRKVFVWNKRYWGILFALAATLTVYSYLLLGGL